MNLDEPREFREELLECAKLIKLPKEDYTQELFKQIGLEPFTISNNNVKETIISESKNRIEHHIGKWIVEDQNAITLLKEVIKGVQVSEIESGETACESKETINDYYLEQPLFPRHVEEIKPLQKYPVLSLMQLSKRLPKFEVIESEELVTMEQGTMLIEDLCNLNPNITKEEIEYITSILHEQQKLLHQQQTNFHELCSFDALLDDLYLEESLIPVKDYRIINQRFPKSFSEIIMPLVDKEFKEASSTSTSNENTNDQLVPEEKGIKVPLEWVNEWEGISDHPLDSEETVSASFSEVPVELDATTWNDMQLELALIPAKKDPIEANNRKRQLKKSKTVKDEDSDKASIDDLAMMNSLAKTIQAVVPFEKDMLKVSPLDQETESLINDMEKLFAAKIKGNEWKTLILEQSMDEVGGLKFEVPELPHPSIIAKLKSSLKCPFIPSRLSDLVARRSRNLYPDLQQYLVAFTGIKTFELELHWNPIKNLTILSIEKTANVEWLTDDAAEGAMKKECWCDVIVKLMDNLNFMIDQIEDDEKIIARKCEVMLQHTKKLTLSHSGKNSRTNELKERISSQNAIMELNPESSSCIEPTNIISERKNKVTKWLESIDHQQDEYFSNSTAIIKKETERNSEISFDEFSFNSADAEKRKLSLFNNLDSSNMNTEKFSAARAIDRFLTLRDKPINNKGKEHISHKQKSIISRTPSNQVFSPNLHRAAFPSPIYLNPIYQQKQESTPQSENIYTHLPIPITTHTYIISSRLLQNRAFVTALRSEDCKVELIERDFEYLRTTLPDNVSTTQHVDADLILDEESALIFLSLLQLSQQNSASNKKSSTEAALSILHLHKKYANLYLVLETYAWNQKSNDSIKSSLIPYPFTSPNQKALNELLVILESCECNVEIFFSSREEISARYARMIGDCCAEKCNSDDGGEGERQTNYPAKGWKSRRQWESRQWMATEESLHERFLTSFSPLINAFAAQIILTATTLSEFLRMTHKERIDLFSGWIDETRLAKFDETINGILCPEEKNSSKEKEVDNNRNIENNSNHKKRNMSDINNNINGSKQENTKFNLNHFINNKMLNHKFQYEQREINSTSSGIFHAVGDEGIEPNLYEEILNTVSSIIFSSILQGELPGSSKKNKEYYVLLGFFHEHGIGTRIDPTAAFQFYKIGALAGDANAQRLYGHLDPEMAFRWYEEASISGNVAAQYLLGFCYMLGIGTDYNLELAFKWFKTSAEKGDEDGQFELAQCYRFGDGVSCDHKLSYFWYKRAADAGHADALIELARCYSEGRGIRQNHRKGFLAWRISAYSKKIVAYPWLASAYEVGWGTMKDKHEAVRWYIKSMKYSKFGGRSSLDNCLREK
ncbi:4840_t:CDS:10 [Ambispora gerdemannii]|uniref:4840_t:CDS:1 n=1 Tax=Ambispora gerdemannii TaxID=144530 RepID=A0A9N9ACP4_9GLOM|nr:4840_t:CDS:10 [Ambispora gerdemannii]